VRQVRELAGSERQSQIVADTIVVLSLPAVRGLAEQRGRAGWRLDGGGPWLDVKATGRRGALDAERTAVAEWLEVSPDAFDLEFT
jgi:hypothetical protein